MTAATGPTLEARVKSLARAMGFDRVGIAAAGPTPHGEDMRDWLARGFAGDMAYLVERAEERADPRRVLTGAQSIIAVGLVYATGGSTPGEAEAGPRIARYARGDDYHDVVLDRLRALEAGLVALVGEPLRTRAYVDTGPVMERAWAAEAGLGWVGKNTCLIDPALGSYLFLGVLLTDLALVPDGSEPDHCGSCTACLDACPTDAFVAPYRLDATRCIAYTTIEASGAPPALQRRAQDDHVFGCDICQEVCPWNRRPRETLPDPLGLRARLAPREAWVRPTLDWLLSLDEDAWREVTRRSAMRRGRYRGLMRNALVAAGNSGDPSLVARVERFAQGDDPLLAECARWALQRLAGQEASGSLGA